MNSIRQAKANDFPSIQKLLQDSELPINDVPADNQVFFVCEVQDEIIGALAIEGQSPNALLRSFAVKKDAQNKGFGKALYEYALLEANKKGIKNLFLLTTTAASYFNAKGWIYINRENVPEDLQNTAEFSEICPSSAACMFFAVNDDTVKEAINFFLSDLNCCQSVFAAHANKLGLDKTSALKMSTGFGGGIAGRGDICGAVTGAYMAIGLRYGRSKSDDLDAKQKTLDTIAVFDKQFKNRNRSLHCNSLLNTNMQNKEAKQILIENGAFEKICPRFIKDATEILKDLL